MAKTRESDKAVRPNVFMRIGLFIKQIIDELRKVVSPSGKELLGWSFAVFVFVLILMALVTGMDFGLGKLTLWIFG
ncbi:MAG: preprotein translocase subunit SecE [Bifidobacterium mongoliense]|jgi:preprotein translocase subunit SecE|uniref:Protein translocase subunit SecE n=2 Tax=Bifidobacterium mongoliense TaxID=518643 RepID=A0A087C0D0_9BIFI|nr:preprotein translocase subunit SecE [Bifidobacterium mongoliense]KFI76730.1 preprotein translocase subunit SecE [Bifidobacterium mongoliense DSM 21395]MDN5633448.1 preprotein translocase subunit SecE [Bifidobacterium mongoliense]MDN5979837.1 preprotein translocase subunit SecE [Bifidobacterium mongoliense]MDN6025233.1 preprotein translocase subunit SecE [Bifidobacterium mongoliense]MDN6051884.1 preprotein translocase subunit SecE [Bifidobacterium mongoliense]